MPSPVRYTVAVPKLPHSQRLCPGWFLTLSGRFA
jgi:hypothetical protein